MNINNLEQYGVFKDLPWFNATNSRIIIGGAGGIGSWLATLLTRAGFPLYICDMDYLEKRNFGGQLYLTEDINLSKTEALCNFINRTNTNNANMYSKKRFTKEHSFVPFMMSAFDNMQARKDMFAVWKRNLISVSEHSSVEQKNPIFIDGRLEAEFLQIFCVTRDTASAYEDYLYDDEEIESAACTMKQTSHVAAMIGSFMVSFFTNHITNIVERNYVRDVPFKFEIFTPLTLIDRI